MKNFRLLTAGTFAMAFATLVPAQSVEPKNTVITSNGPGEMVSTDKETTFTFKDHVVVTGTNMRMNCDFLEIVVLRSGDQTATVGKAEKFKSMLATGNVLMVMGDREAACGRAEVLPGDEKVVLSENPVVVDHDQNTRAAGEEITLLRGQRRVLIKNPVITAPPVKDLGVDKEPKPVAGAPVLKDAGAAAKESKPAEPPPQSNPPAVPAPKQP
jgi:hypothetical protein